jgi:dinuclear metal center YbgI/SA1388 family protein
MAADIAISEIINFCDGLLDSQSFDDWSPNGLQLDASNDTGLIVTGVSARLSLFEMAAEMEAGLVIVHHGILHGAGGPIDRRQAARLYELLDNGISLAQYHLPLDAHPEIGNNALLAEAIGATVTGRCCSVRGREIGVVGEWQGDGLHLDDLAALMRDACGQDPLIIDAGDHPIRSAAIVTGAASGEIGTAADLGLDALITGEPSESSVALAEEAGVHLICGGHHATETLGIEALGNAVADEFGITHHFVNVPNPV